MSIIVAAVGGSVAVIAIKLNPGATTTFIVAIGLLSFAACVMVFAASIRNAKADEGRARARLQTAESRLAEDRLSLPALWEVTHSRLDLYHQIATGQARRSFLTAQVATMLGFTMLITFAVLIVQTRTTAGAIATGALGAVSAALAGYISRTFVRSQESAAGHLRAYFDQPLEFSKYLAAERLFANVGDLNESHRAAILTAVVNAIVAPNPSSEIGNQNKPENLACVS